MYKYDTLALQLRDAVEQFRLGYPREKAKHRPVEDTVGRDAGYLLRLKRITLGHYGNGR